MASNKWSPGCGCHCGAAPCVIVHALGCNGMNLVGATAVLKNGAGTTLDTKTTNAAGLATLSGSGTGLTVTYSKARFVTPAAQSVTCGTNPPAVTLLPDTTGYQCWPGCADPLKLTLNYTDSELGTGGTMVYQPTAIPPGWYANFATPGVAYNFPGCVGCPATPCYVQYQLHDQVTDQGLHITYTVLTAGDLCPANTAGFPVTGCLINAPTVTCPVSGAFHYVTTYSCTLTCNNVSTLTITE